MLISKSQIERECRLTYNLFHQTFSKGVCSLVARRSVKSFKACAKSSVVVTPSPSGAVSPGFVSKSANRVGKRRALFEAAVGSAKSCVAKASPYFHGVPWFIVGVSSHLSKDALWKALSVITTIVPALISLTGHAVKRRVAFALASVTVANTAIGALSERVSIVVLD